MEKLILDSFQSILTGILVGVVLMIVQSRKDRKELSNHYEKDLSKIKERLRFVDFKGGASALDSISDSVPSSVKEIINVIQNYPLDLLQEHARYDRKLIKSLIETRNKYLEMIKISKKLDMEMDSYIRKHNVDRGAPAPNNDIRYKSYFVGKTVTDDDEKINPWIGALGGINDDMSEQFNAFKELKSDLLQDHSKTKEELIYCAEEIEKSIS